jgi:hypothetical protein
MRLPGFTAASSLYRTSGRYRISTSYRPGEGVEAASAYCAPGNFVYRPPSDAPGGCEDFEVLARGCPGPCAAGLPIITPCTGEDIAAAFRRCCRRGCNMSQVDVSGCPGTAIVTCA